MSFFPTTFSSRNENQGEDKLRAKLPLLNPQQLGKQTLAQVPWLWLPGHASFQSTMGTSPAEVSGAPVKCLVILQENDHLNVSLRIANSRWIGKHAHDEKEILHPSTLTICTCVAQGPVLFCIESNINLALYSSKANLGLQSLHNIQRLAVEQWDISTLDYHQYSSPNNPWYFERFIFQMTHNLRSQAVLGPGTALRKFDSCNHSRFNKISDLHGGLKSLCGTLTYL